MSKHTPGPWSISRHWGPCKEHPEWASIDIGEDFKCASGHIGEANARLIAAAPVLLEALQEISSLPDYRSDEAAHIARDAIAKALGENNEQS